MGFTLIVIQNQDHFQIMNLYELHGKAQGVISELSRTAGTSLISTSEMRIPFSHGTNTLVVKQDSLKKKAYLLQNQTNSELTHCLNAYQLKGNQDV